MNSQFTKKDKKHQLEEELEEEKEEQTPVCAIPIQTHPDTQQLHYVLNQLLNIQTKEQKVEYSDNIQKVSGFITNILSKLQQDAHDHLIEFQKINDRTKKKLKKKIAKHKKRTCTVAATDHDVQYDPNPNDRAKRHIKISFILTTNTIPALIKENIDDIYDYLDKTTAIQVINKCEYNNGNIRIINYDLSSLYGVITKKNLNKSKKLSFYEWEMVMLYTSDEIKNKYNINNNQLPKSYRMTDQYKSKLNHEDKVKAILNDNISRKKIFDQINESVPIYNTKKTKARIKMLVTKEEFARNCNHYNSTDDNIIPILMFNKNGKQFVVEYVWIVKYNKDVHVGLSFKYNQDDNTMNISGIHLNKSNILSHYKLVKPDGNNQCIQAFRSNIDVLKIGNPDDDQNKLNTKQIEIDNLNIKLQQQQALLDSLNYKNNNNTQVQTALTANKNDHELYVHLKEMGLERFYDKLKNNGFDTVDSLNYLDKDNLHKIGIKLIGHKMQILGKIKERNNNPLSSRKLFVHSLKYETTDQTLYSVFSGFGDIQEAVVIRDKSNNMKSKGFGFVTYKYGKNAQRALQQPQKIIDGRTVYCSLAIHGKKKIKYKK